MTKTAPKISLNLDLLHPQGEGQKLAVKLINWLLSAGRYIIIFVEILVLGAFLARFKLDGDLIELKENIEEQIPFIQSLKNDEALIRKLQFQITSLREIKTNSPDYTEILKNISKKLPKEVTLQTINFERTIGKTSIKFSGTARNYRQLQIFIVELKSDPQFSDVNLASVELQEGTITFSVTASSKIEAKGES